MTLLSTMSPLSTHPPGTLVSPPEHLSLVSVALRVRAAGGIAQVVLEQRFENRHTEPLRVTYQMPLPSDCAVAGFSFRLGDRIINGRVDGRQHAREQFENAIAEGRTAAILEQDRTSLFTQEIGNIPAGQEVTAEIVLDQRLRWLDEGRWEWRFPLAAAPRYLGACGRTSDADRIALQVSSALAPKATLGLAIEETLSAGRSPESPSHAISTQMTSRKGDGYEVVLGDGGAAPLDRDLVVRWPVATPEPGARIELSRPAGENGSRYGLLTVVPPKVEGDRAYVGRDVILLLDVSGSMQGEPLAQATRVAAAVVDSLNDRDTLEMVAFASRVIRYKGAPVVANATERTRATGWLQSLRAGGGTEMVAGIVEALGGVRSGTQRQVILITDGLIGFEGEVVQAIASDLPRQSRLHTVGVGSSVNRSLLGPAARAGHGVEIIVGLGEDPERAALRLVNRTAAPAIVDLTIEGEAVLDTTPARLPDVFRGAPALIGVRVRPEGGALVLTGRTSEGEFRRELCIGAEPEQGRDSVFKLYGRERVEDLEMELAEAGNVRGHQRAQSFDREIERLGIQFQIATRVTSWVALSEELDVDPRTPTRHQRVPQMVPFGMSVEGLGLRSAAPPGAAMPMQGSRVRSAPMSRSMAIPPPPAMAPPPSQAFGAGSGGPPPPPSPKAPAPPRSGLQKKGSASFEDGEGFAEADAAAAPADKVTAYEAKEEIAADEPIARSALGRLVERVREAIGGAPPSHERTITGRIVMVSVDSITIELDVDGEGLEWDLEVLSAELVDSAAPTVLSIISERSTASASLMPGHTIRLSLRTPNGTNWVRTPPSALRLTLPTTMLTIALSR